MFGFSGWLAKLTGDDAVARDERQFLPAALEVLETPASPTGRALALSIGAFFTVTLIWSLAGRIDIIATAPGRLLPQGKVKVIQSLDPGVVRAIRVQDGDGVRAGQVLIELDTTQTGADRDRFSRDLQRSQLDVARLTALKRTAETGGAPASLIIPPGADADDVGQMRAALHSQVEGQAARLRGLDDQIAQKRAEAAEVTATIAKLNAGLPLLAEKERLHRDLHDQGYGTTFSYLDSQQALSDARNDLKVMAQRGVQARAAQANLSSQRAQASAEFAAQILADLAKAEEKNNELNQALIKAREKAQDTQLRAPVDGVVEQLAVHTVGGVVTPAERLAEIVPGGRGLTVEAQLANRDVGFVHPGQDVAIKVEAFAFTRYGLLHGKVIAVSRDSQTAPEAPLAPGASPAPGGAPASPTYVARIAVDRSDMQVDGKTQPLIAGMAVTAEIKTGRRSIMDYLLSPLARKSDEAMHER